VTEPALAIAERALAAAGGGGDGALARVTRERSLMLRFARSRPTQATAVDDLTVELCALRDGHVGSATTNATDARSLTDCARAAAAAAEAAARSAGTGPYPGFPAAAAPRPHTGHDPDTARLDPAAGGAALAEVFAAAARHGVEAHGTWTAAEVEAAVASSTGAAVSERVTDAFAKAVCIAPSGRSGYAAESAVAAAGIDPARIGERAAAKAAAGGEPVRLEPGEHPVVLERHALAELLALLSHCAFDGRAHAEGRGALAGRLGTRVAAPSINLSDSPRYAGTLPRAFDAEGVPKAPLPLIQDGVAHAVVHDTRSAAIAGARGTGHALSPGGAEPPLPTNMVLAGGGAADEAELCAPVERGVYVTRLWYGNVVREREALVTAVTRDGTFLIEDGKPGAPLHDMRLTDEVLRILAGVQALGARSELTGDGEFYGRRFATGIVCPPVRVAAVRLS
jgi:predicted Zn-dependent protease